MPVVRVDAVPTENRAAGTRVVVGVVDAVVAVPLDLVAGDLLVRAGGVVVYESSDVRERVLRAVDDVVGHMDVAPARNPDAHLSWVQQRVEASYDVRPA